jgi:16S rRNA processing protein RimM
VYSHTDPREAVLQYKTWLLHRSGEWQPAQVAEGQRHGKSVIVRLEGIDDRNMAQTLVGTEFGVMRATLPQPDEGQYYWSDILGSSVVNRNGVELGKLKSILETGAHDVMVVQGDKERLIPFVQDEIVLDVDLALQRITVDWEWD